MAQLKQELKTSEAIRLQLLAQLANELKKSEVNREELLALLREYQAIRVEHGVSDSEDLMRCMHIKVNENCRRLLSDAIYYSGTCLRQPPSGQF